MKLTKAQRQFMELALRSPNGNPFRLIGTRQMTGGAKRRMFDALQASGYFDKGNCITDAGRAALQERANG